VGVIFALFYLIGGMGVRQGNWLAAASVFLVHLLGNMVHFADRRSSNPILTLYSVAITVILLSNLRATFLASEWKPLAEGEDRPSRFNETWGDKFVDQMPAKLWTPLQIPFVILSAMTLLISLAMVAVAVAGRIGLLPSN
jgi:hypothetical protein